jgi:hypothetical protein
MEEFGLRELFRLPLRLEEGRCFFTLPFSCLGELRVCPDGTPYEVRLLHIPLILF